LFAKEIPVHEQVAPLGLFAAIILSAIGDPCLYDFGAEGVSESAVIQVQILYYGGVTQVLLEGLDVHLVEALT